MGTFIYLFIFCLVWTLRHLITCLVLHIVLPSCCHMFWPGDIHTLHCPQVTIYLFDYVDGPVCCLIVLYCLLAGNRVFCAVDLDHLTVLSDTVWFGHTNKMHRREQFLKLLVLQFASSSCHFFPLWFTYSLQPPLFKDLQFLFLPLTWEKKFCMCQNSR